MDVAQVMEEAPKGSHFYCCGPVRLLDTFDKCSESYPPDHCHSERFIADVEVAKGGYTIVLARSGKTLYISEEQTILDALNISNILMISDCTHDVREALVM